MRPLVVALAFSCLAGPACTREPPPTPPPRDAPVAPGAPMNLDKIDRTRVGVDLAQATAAIKMYKMTNGSLPADLSTLGLRLSYPNDIVYDRESGTVRSKTFPDLRSHL